MKNTWTIVGIVLIVVLALLLLGSVGMMGLGFGARGMMGNYGGLGMMGGFRSIGWLVSCVVGLLIIGGIAALIVWLARNAGKTPSTSAAPMTIPSAAPLDILKTRYAKGEITKEQFDAMKQDLM